MENVPLCIKCVSVVLCRRKALDPENANRSAHFAPAIQTPSWNHVAQWTCMCMPALFRESLYSEHSDLLLYKRAHPAQKPMPGREEDEWERGRQSSWQQMRMRRAGEEGTVWGWEGKRAEVGGFQWRIRPLKLMGKWQRRSVWLALCI